VTRDYKKTQVNVGIAFSRWIELMQEKEVLLSSRQVRKCYSHNYKLYFLVWLCTLLDRWTFIV